MADLLTSDGLLLVGLMLAAGAVAGIAAGLFGIGGGFVVVPTLVAIFGFAGVDPDVAVHTAIGTSLGTIILTSLRSVTAHARRGAVDFEVLRGWAPWIVLGVGGGLLVASRADGATLILIFGLGLLLLSPTFLFPHAFRNIRLSEEMPGGAARAALASFLGGVSALLGIGGGTIAVLTMTFCGRPIHQAVATAAGFGAVIAIPGTVGFAVIGLGADAAVPGSVGYINVPGLVAIASTSVLTAPLGASLAHRLPASTLKRVFGAYLVFTSFMMLRDTGLSAGGALTAARQLLEA